MAQARRKKSKVNPRRGSGRNLKPAITALKQGIGFFVTGALTGVLALLYWQGYQSDAEGDLGSGIRAMISRSEKQAAIRAAENIAPEPVLVDNAPRIKPQYDFYTVLPEIEEVLPKDAPDLPPVASVNTQSAPKPKAAKATVENVRQLPPGGAYMLQVASYGHQADADRLKARLALSGMRASIQKVSIENKNYFRVRIGPYADYGTMTADDYKLSKLGFKAMRLRISKAG